MEERVRSRQVNRENHERDGAVARSAAKSVPARCGAPTKLGGICTAPATMRDGRCPHHSSTVSERTRRAWRDRGRRNALLGRKPIAFPKADFSDAERLQKLLEAVTDAVLAGKLPTSTAKAVSSLFANAAKLPGLRLEEQIVEAEQHIATAQKKRL